MIANYGYRDGSGEYYVTIDTDLCIECEGRWCVEACPERLFEIARDDYDDEVATIVASARKLLKERCSGCKPAGGYGSLPCTTACEFGAISHSW
ncbi:MAG: ferredoxin [Actinobacteria bacterium]|nr:ferredoxin [Actinomycetota bacterium]